MAKKKKPITSLKSSREIFERVSYKRKKGVTPWKMPTKRVHVKKRSDAVRIGRAIGHYSVGYEVKKTKKGYSVGSKGYYHYVGS